MLTPNEIAKIDKIKAATLARKPVSSADKQWVLDLLKREQLAIRADVHSRATAAGFNTAGIEVERV